MGHSLEFLQSLEALFTTTIALASSSSFQVSSLSGITVMTLIAWVGESRDLPPRKSVRGSSRIQTSY
jgi:hypothetical protein